MPGILSGFASLDLGFADSRVSFYRTIRTQMAAHLLKRKEGKPAYLGGTGRRSASLLLDPECFLQVIHTAIRRRSTNYAPCVSKITSSRYKLQTCVISFPYTARIERLLEAERELEARPTCQWTCRHFENGRRPARRPVNRFAKNSESTELHSLTMLQACSHLLI